MSRTPNRVRIYDYILSRGKQGATDEETEEALSLSHQTVSAVRGELSRMNALVDTCECRLTRTGNKATVRVAVVGVDVSKRPPRSLVDLKGQWIRSAMKEVGESTLDKIIMVLRRDLGIPDDEGQADTLSFFGADLNE